MKEEEETQEVLESDPTDIYLLIEGEQSGPYAEEEVRQCLADGLFSGDLLAWRQGLTEWTEVELLVAAPDEMPATTAEMGSLLAAGAALMVRPDEPTRLAFSDPQKKKRHDAIGLICGAVLLLGAVLVGHRLGLSQRSHPPAVLIRKRPRPRRAVQRSDQPTFP